MDVFSLMNPHARNECGEVFANRQVVHVRTFIKKTPQFLGPNRPPGFRRRLLRSKNCANAKKLKANSNKRRLQQEKETDKASIQLQQQIRELDQKLAFMSRRTVLARHNTQGAALNVMRTYYDLLGRGLDAARYPVQAKKARQFLKTAFVSNVKTNDFTGLDKFIDQWQLISEIHTSIDCKAERIDVYPLIDGLVCGEDLPVNVVKTYGTTTLQISRTTIERIFPHILADESLVQSLIGRSYSFSFNLFAYVDARDGRVFQIESKVDLTSALLELLQDPFATIKMVDAAAMTKRGNLLLMDDILEDQNVIENGFL